MNKLVTNVSRRGFVKGAAGASAMAVMAGLAGCGGGQAANSADSTSTQKATYKLEMVTDTGGVNDQSFNQLAWEGLQKLKTDEGWDVSYLESKQDSDYATNLDKAVDDGSNLIWGIGFAMADAVGEAATKNPDIQFAIIDNANPTDSKNLTGVQFRAQEPSFMVGYIAACTTKTGKVGFVGGVASDVIAQFEFGYKGGVAYANKVKGLNVEVTAQYAESFTDSAKGKSIAAKMFTDGCDVVFHAAGGVGTGVIEAAKDANKFAIGVDKDQNFLAPDNVLTSALKKVDVAVIDVSKRLLNKELEGGSNISLGAKEDCVGIPENHSLMEDSVYNEALEIESKIKSGDIVPPASEAELTEFASKIA